MSKGIDMTGWIMSEHGVTDSNIKVLERTTPPNNTKSHGVFWLCECLLCHKIFSARGDTLRNGERKNCGCQINRNYDDIKGKTFNYLTAIENTHKVGRNHTFIWKCQCKCGKTVEVDRTYLLNGHVKSCGCWRQEATAERRLHDLTGQQFGFLTVLKQNTDKKTKDAYWDCKCKCGNIKTIIGISLINGRTLSCGCNRVSFGEQFINQILTENNISFKYNSPLDDLVNARNNKLRYDFIILNDNQEPIRFIEFDGPQHKQPVEIFGGEEAFLYQKQNDQIKNKYAIEHNIPLVRIPYSQRNNITFDMLMGDEYLIKEEN